MKKNLVFVAAGDESLHHEWADSNYRQFDVMIAYYGKGEKLIPEFKQFFIKGTKFGIVHKIYKGNHFDDYDAILILDDDLFISADDLNRFFTIFHEYDLWMAQPSIIGWYSVVITLTVPGSLLRYTNWVEIMCPCFNKDALKLCSATFVENNSNWGIERIWNDILKNPKDKIAIIDSVSAIHTRPCFFGDVYHRNQNTFHSACADAEKIIDKYNLDCKLVVYNDIKITQQTIDKLPSENKFFPNVKLLESKCNIKRNSKKFIF